MSFLDDVQKGPSKLKLYGEIRQLSEFGKSFNAAYIKTIDGVVYKINDKTFLLPFSQIHYYKD